MNRYAALFLSLAGALTCQAATLTLSSSGGGLFTYGLILADNETVGFTRGNGITLSGMGGVTSQTLSGDLDFCLDPASSTSGSAAIQNLTAFAAGCSTSNLSGSTLTELQWTIQAPSAILGTINYTINSIQGTFTGTVLGPVSPPSIPPIITLLSSGGGSFTYGMVQADGVSTGFLRDHGITLSGMFGVTGQSLSNNLDFCLDPATHSASSASIQNLTAFAGGCTSTNLSGSPLTLGTWTIQSAAAGVGVVDYSIDSMQGLLTGQVLGPVDLTAAPEPAAGSLAAGALLMLCLTRRKRAGR